MLWVVRLWHYSKSPENPLKFLKQGCDKIRCGMLQSRLEKSESEDFPGCPVDSTSSNAEGAGSLPGWGAKIPHASGPKDQNIKQKQYRSKFNKGFKNGSHQKNPKQEEKSKSGSNVFPLSWWAVVTAGECWWWIKAVGDQSCTLGTLSSVLERIARGRNNSEAKRIVQWRSEVGCSWWENEMEAMMGIKNLEENRGFPVGSVVKNPPAVQETWVQFLVRKIRGRRAWQLIPVFLSGKSQGQRSLVGYGPWGHKESKCNWSNWACRQHHGWNRQKSVNKYVAKSRTRLSNWTELNNA